MRSPLPFLAVILALAGAFHLATIRAGHDWGDDFSMYILHAKNLAEGRSYVDTGFIRNSQRTLGPHAYPPVFPALLAPVYALWGLDLVAMKALIVLLFLGTLLILFVLARPFLPASYLLALMAILAVNPYFWQFKEQVLSDIPFLFFTCLALLLVERAPRLTATAGTRIVLAVLTGAVLYLAYGTRSIGIVLLPVLFLHDLLRRRRLEPSTLLSAGVFVLAAGAQAFLLASDADYLKMYTFDTATMLKQGTTYMWGPRVLWQGGLPPRPTNALVVVVSGLALAGFILRCARPRACELFVASYLPPVVLFPAFQDGRYLIPILPFYLYYALYAVARGAALVPRPVGAFALPLFLLPIALCYGRYYARADFGPIPDGVDQAEARAFFRYVRDHTEPRAVFVSRKPRAFALYTGRSASVYHRPKDEGELWRYLRDIKAAYLVLSPPDNPYWRDFVEAQAPRVTRIYASGDFELFRIVELPEAWAP